MRGQTVEYAPVGATLNNGYDLGGSRIYPWSTSLAIAPPAEYSNYIGSASGLPVTSPISALSATSGAPAAGTRQAMAMPFGRHSPLPWVIGGLIVAVLAIHSLHYKPSRASASAEA